MSRLFFAIPLDDACQRALQALLHPLRAPLAGVHWLQREDRHLTLAFLGEVSARHEQCLCAALPLPLAPFNIALDALERFPDGRGRILAATGPATAALLALQREVLSLIAQCGLSCATAERPLRPHITLARWGSALQPAIPAPQAIALHCRVERVRLYCSEVVEGQRRYRPLA